MKKLLITLLFISSCTQSGASFIDCSDEKNANLALNIAIENMDSINEVVARTDFICKKNPPMPNVACYIARTGNKDFGNRGMIVMQDEYSGECVIHELYHVQLGVKNNNSCETHSIKCGWDVVWLEVMLDEYKESKNL
jgi:hypothetical protein